MKNLKISKDDLKKGGLLKRATPYQVITISKAIMDNLSVEALYEGFKGQETEIKARIDVAKRMAIEKGNQDCLDMAITLSDLILHIQLGQNLLFEKTKGKGGRPEKTRLTERQVSRDHKLKNQKHRLKFIEDRAEKEGKSPKIILTEILPQFREKTGDPFPTASKLNDFIKGRNRMKNCTGFFEWYTPKEVIEAARFTLGSIQLDPASCAEANQVVKAKTFYAIQDKPLEREWKADTAFMNPPYARDLITKFTDKLIKHVKAKDIGQAIVLTNDSTDAIWFHNLLGVSNCFCFVRGRLQFWGSQISKSAGPLQGQSIFGLNVDKEKFEKSFQKIGKCLPIKGSTHSHPRSIQPLKSSVQLVKEGI